jgi:hypothetical protein
MIQKTSAAVEALSVKRAIGLMVFDNATSLQVTRLTPKMKYAAKIAAWPARLPLFDKKLAIFITNSRKFRYYSVNLHPYKSRYGNEKS